jgi:hypothetical protein
MYTAIKKFVLEFPLVLAVSAIALFVLLQSIYFAINILKKKRKSPNKSWVICILDLALGFA